MFVVAVYMWAKKTERLNSNTLKKITSLYGKKKDLHQLEYFTIINDGL